MLGKTVFIGANVLSRSYICFFLICAAGGPNALRAQERLAVNGQFAPDPKQTEMPLNWMQNKGDWFKPHGEVKFLGPNQLQVVTNANKSVYIDETTRFAVVPGASVNLKVFARGVGSAGFLVHLYTSKGKRLATLTSATQTNPEGGAIAKAHRLNEEYKGIEVEDLTPASMSVGIFIEKNSDIVFSDFAVEYRAIVTNTALEAANRGDWAESEYVRLTRLAARADNVPLLFLGDSITHSWEFATDNRHPGGLDAWKREFEPLGAANFGVAGDKIQNVLYRITEGKQLAGNPGVVVLMIGTNNLSDNTPDEIVAGIDKLLDAIRDESSSCQVLLLGILPRQGHYPIDAINTRLRELRKKPGVAFLDVGDILLRGESTVQPDIFRDGLHLSPKGYDLLAESIKPEISRLMAANKLADQSMPEARSDWRIYVAADAIMPEEKAAGELQWFFSRIFGETPDIVRIMPQGGKMFLVGQSPEAAALLGDLDFAALGNDEILLRKRADTIVLAGARPRGSLYAVYAFLENHLGVEFYSSFEQEYPELTDFKIPDFDLRQTPSIKARGAFFHDLLYTNPLFAVRLRNNEDFLKDMADYGCEINFVGGVHTFDRFIPAKNYLATNPEFFGLRNGKRVGGQGIGQLCLSNDAMRGEFIRNVLALLRDNPKATMISVSQNDNNNPCECEPCAAENEKEGSPAGPMLRFVNQVAEAVEAEFPSVTVQTFAYQYTSTPPRFSRPRHNVEVRLCTIGCNFAAPLDSDGNAPFQKELREWAKIAPRLSIWNYVANFENYLAPFPNMKTMAGDIAFFAVHNVGAVFEQGDWNSGGVTGDFVQLKAYLISKLLWDSTQDTDRLVEDFLHGYYGAAAAGIGEYLALLNDEVAEVAPYMGCFLGQTSSIMRLATIRKAWQLMTDADESVTAGEYKFRERVKIASLPIRFTILERAVALVKEYGHDVVDLKEILEETLAIAKRNRTSKYQESRSFAELEIMLRENVAQALAYRPRNIEPAACAAGLSAGEFWEIQSPARQVDDPVASDGVASRIGGESYTWAFQYHPDMDVFPMEPGRYRVVVSARAELNPEAGGAEGMGMEAGSYDRLTKKNTMKNIPLSDLAGGEYREFDLGIHELNKNCYLYAAPKKNERMKFLYVDRLTVIAPTCTIQEEIDAQ